MPSCDFFHGNKAGMAQTRIKGPCIVNEQTARTELLNCLAEIERSIIQVKSDVGVVALDQTANGRLTRMDARQQAATFAARLVRLENDV